MKSKSIIGQFFKSWQSYKERIMNNPQQLSVKDALKTIEAQPAGQVLQQYIDSLQKKSEVVNLGTDEAFALRDSGGEIRAFKQNLVLSAANDGLVQPVWSGPFTISAQGYEMWAEAKGASVIFPREVMVGSEWKPNPYVEFDSDGQRARLIYARAVAFCYSSKGLPQVVDWSTIYDVHAYRLIDLLSKAKKAKAAFKLLPTDMTPETKSNETWAAYKFDEATRIWINTRHDEAIKWYATILNREKKAIDFAQTFARRNALKHLSGLQKPPGQSKNNAIAEWRIPVISWRPTTGSIIRWDAAQYKQLQDNVVKLIEGTSDFETEVDVVTGKEQVENDDVSAVVGADPEEQAEEAIDIEPVSSKVTRQPHDPGPETPEDDNEQQDAANEAVLSEDELKLWRQLEFAREEFPNEWAKALQELDIAIQAPTPILMDRGEEIYKLVSRLVEGSEG